MTQFYITPVVFCPDGFIIILNIQVDTMCLLVQYVQKLEKTYNRQTICTQINWETNIQLGNLCNSI